MLREGLVLTVNQKALITIGFPSHVLEDDFTSLYYLADTVFLLKPHDDCREED